MTILGGISALATIVIGIPQSGHLAYLLVHSMDSDMLTNKVADVVTGSLASSSLVYTKHTVHSVPGDNPSVFKKGSRDFLTGFEMWNSVGRSEDAV